MKVLLVEDQKLKIDAVSDLFRNSYPSAVLVKRYSYNSGLNEGLDNEFDLAIFDMSLPTFDRTELETGGRPRVLGGQELAKRFQAYGRLCPFLVFTQFGSFQVNGGQLKLSDLDNELRSEFGDKYLGAVLYRPEENWEKSLSLLINKIADPNV